MDNNNSKVCSSSERVFTTFASFIKNVEPDWNIKIFERLDQPAIESSNERNNAGTDMLHCVNSTTRLNSPTVPSISIRQESSMNSLSIQTVLGLPC